MPRSTTTAPATLADATVTLTAPDGWSVSPSESTSLGTVAASGSAAATWQVAAPADTPAGLYSLHLVATYTAPSGVTAGERERNTGQRYSDHPRIAVGN